MSVQVANIDFSSAIVGQTGRIVNLSQLLPPPTLAQQMRPQDNQQVAHLSMFNESGALLTVLLPETLQTKTLPAGRWLILPIPPNETEVDYQIVALAAGAPFHNLLVDYFYPGEAVEALGVVGNSPVGVSGNVSTSGAGGTSFIKNDGAAPATSIIEATPSDQVSSAWSMNNDASGFLQILSANVLRKIFNFVRGNNTTGKAAVTLGDSGDATILTMYGSVQGGQPANMGAVTAGLITASAVNGSALSTTQIAAGSSSPSDMLNMIRTGAFGTGQMIIGIDANGRFYIFDNGHGGAFAAQNISSETTSNAGGRVVTARSNGGGAAGWVNWQGTTDPGTNAAEGDTWDKG